MPEFREGDHPRGQPGNSGQFGESGGTSQSGGSAPLTEHEKTSLQHYTLAGSYPINDFLRNGTTVEKGKYAGATQLRSSEDVNKAVDGMDAAFAKASLDKETTVYRGVNDAAWSVITQQAKDGSIIQDNGFVSTASNKKDVTASSLTHWMTIKVPKGYSAIPLDGVVGNRTKGEILLNRGTKFRVVKLTRNNAVLEVIP